MNQASPSASRLTRAGSPSSSAVDLDDLAGHRRIDFARRLDALDHRRLAALGHCLADRRQFDEDDIAQLLLGVVGDADGGDVAIDSDPFMVLGVMLWLIGYSLSVCKLWGTKGSAATAAGNRLVAHDQSDLGVRASAKAAST